MSIDNNPNKKNKSRENTINRRARAIGATLMLAGGAATGLLLANNAQDASPVQPQSTPTEAPASTSEAITNEVNLNELFDSKAGAFINALDADTSGNVQKTQLAPNGNYQGGFVQFSYIVERDGMTASVNVITMAGPDQDKPDLDSLADFSAKLSIPGAVPPTDTNPLGNADMYSVSYTTGEGPAVLSGEADGVQFKINQRSVDINDPSMSAQLDDAWKALDSIQGFATQSTE